MKIKLAVSDETYAGLAAFFAEKGIEIDESAPFVLTETDKYISHLSVRGGDGERLHIATDDIIYLESFGHTVDVHTADGVYQSGDRLYQLCYMLDPAKFVRISNSVIIARGKVKKIIPSFSMKFVLVMSNGARVDVTRTYYNSFKEFFGI